MSLRLRLVLGLVALLVVGLAAFGIATYTLYAPSQYQRLDDQLRSSLPYADMQLYEKAGIHDDAGSPSAGQAGDMGESSWQPSDPGSTHRPPPDGSPLTTPLPPGTVSELLNAKGKVLASTQYLGASTARPKLSRPLPAVPTNGRFITTGSTTGDGTWQVLLAPASGSPGDVVAIAVPSSAVTAALHKLLFIEVSVAAGLLGLLSLGSWLVLRRGLRPLEDMADSARSIAAGDLSRRVGPEGGPAEVAQLGRALDTMLADIETAFAEREANEQRLRRFLADASHELRTPLTSIQGFAELFRLGVDNEHVDQPTIVRRIEDEAGRMHGLVEDLLLLARLDLVPEPQQDRVDLAVLAADACSDAVAMAPGRKVSLHAPEPADITGDANHLRQAIANLVANAVRHTPEGTPIEVAVRRAGETAVVSVRDHGPGLDADGLQHVFDRFWRADTARSGAGAGLGLSIVAAIAAQHGGAAVAANAESGGAVFSLRLPVGTAPVASPSHRYARQDAEDGSEAWRTGQSGRRPSAPLPRNTTGFGPDPRQRWSTGCCPRAPARSSTSAPAPGHLPGSL